MSSSIRTILVIGATSGIGEAFARRFHADGKQVVATGRREENLRKLAAECPGLKTYVMDNSDLARLPDHVATLTQRFPDINTVWINSGLQYSYSFTDDMSKFGDAEIIQEINVNITAPTILARHFIPHLLQVRGDAILMITSSGMAFMPSAEYPVYSITKAGIHQLCGALRHQLHGTNVSVLELVPTYVATELDAKHKDVAGGFAPMPLDEYTDAVFKILDANEVKGLKEVGVGFGEVIASKWREAFQPVLDQFGNQA